MKSKAWIIAAFGFLATPLFSQGMQDSIYSIAEVAVTAERIFQKEEAGMKQSDVDSTVMQQKVSVSLSDLLSENTTVFIKNHGRGALATASFRGTSASHTQVNWNGISINSPMAGIVDFSLIPVYIIDELNLKYGAASLADRSGGIGGSINISNRAGWNEKSSIRYIQGIGSYNTFDQFLQLGLGKNKIRSKTRLYYNHSKNDYTFFNRGIGNIDPLTGTISNPLDTNENAAYTRYGLLQEFYYRPAAKHLFSMKYWGQFADRTIPRPTSYEGPNNSNLNNQQDGDHRLVADWKYYGDFGKLILRTGYSAKHLVYEQMNQVPGLGLVPAIFSESRQQSLFNTLSYSGEGGNDFSWEGSIDLNHHQVESVDTVSHFGYTGDRDELSMMLALRKGFADRVNLNLMLRQEWADGGLLPFIPFFGIELRLLEGVDLLLKGSVARNYHQPSLNDLYWQPGGNPDLLPEQGFTVESGLEFQQLISGLLLKTELSIYRSDIDNWILWIPSNKGFWEPRNIRRVLSTGVEYNLQVQGTTGEFTYKLSTTYAYTSSVSYGDQLVWGDESYGKQLVYIPLHSGNIMTRLEWGNFFFAYQYNAYSERYTTSSNDLSRRDWLYPYFMNDISAGSTFRMKNLEGSLELKVYNLFNESYHSVLYRPMPGRNFQVIMMIKI